jgi:hypothetical protein
MAKRKMDKNDLHSKIFHSKLKIEEHEPSKNANDKQFLLI